MEDLFRLEVIELPLPPEALPSVLLSEPSTLVTGAAGSEDTLSNNSTLPDGWTCRITRLVLVNEDNAIRTITITAGESGNETRTSLLTLALSNYERVVLEEDDLRNFITSFRASSSQNNLIYASIDAFTVGIRVAVLEYIQEIL
jgi:hypothetical protein